MHSSSMVAYLVWVGVSEAEPHWMSDHFFFGSGWSSAKPFSRGGEELPSCGRGQGRWLWAGLANPRNDLIWDTFSGVGNSAIALYLLSSGLIPAWLIMWPANEISFPISNFLREIVMFSSLHLCRIMPALSLSSPRFGAQMSVSSTIFLAQEARWLFYPSGSTIHWTMHSTPLEPLNTEIFPVAGERWWEMSSLLIEPIWSIHELRHFHEVNNVMWDGS